MVVPRQYSFPRGHWNWPVDLSHHHAVRAGNLIFTGGQVDLDDMGNVRNVGDLEAQCSNSMSYMATLLEDLGVEFSDLVRLVVYYVGDAQDEANILNQLAEIIGADVRPVVNMIGMPELCYPDMLTEIEGVAMRAPDGSKLPRQNFYLEDMPHLPQAFSHVVRSGDMIFTGDMSASSQKMEIGNEFDLVSQTTIMMDRLQRALLAVGANMLDVVKMNTFNLSDRTAKDFATAAEVRASYFSDPSPANTSILLPSFPHTSLEAKAFATAMVSCDAATAEEQIYFPIEDHWTSSVQTSYSHGVKSGNVIHIGGQVSLDSSANVVHPDDMVSQTKVAMDYIRRVLAAYGATLDDVVKITTFYQGKASAEALHENLLIRSNSYTAPGPATTGIPVVGLVNEGTLIEIEAIAVLD
jgi:enamine deaminase RidA (YjgF/YER057c/UK114 family)